MPIKQLVLGGVNADWAEGVEDSTEVGHPWAATPSEVLSGAWSMADENDDDDDDEPGGGNRVAR